ncbi:helix-turn-helix domain-containing protein [Undibacterium sp. Jales W-56]|uniref:helix-turn-helix domain-containing protein n=1 Tax=Undibacterium sp. Jales W-56 TaxID=2897325 RepID=UPI0021D231F4|nr:helix-turn-helix transcriptional regulator [Undibacterium sp. Jales W-56]MCU6434203.1 helix-turn-helix domain-containing protein [Undibacterium sp. Jales W-56]
MIARRYSKTVWVMMANQDLVEFGLHLKKLRQEKGLSQEQLGLIAELDRTYISGIERGVRNVSLANIFRIAKALDVPAAALFADLDGVQ